jgi:hypothetical protein
VDRGEGKSGVKARVGEVLVLVLIMVRVQVRVPVTAAVVVMVPAITAAATEVTEATAPVAVASARRCLRLRTTHHISALSSLRWPVLQYTTRSSCSPLVR